MTPMLVLAGMLLDAVIGEPRRIWNRVAHPAVLMGRLVGLADRHFNNNRKSSGVLVAAGLVASGAAIGILIQFFGPVVEIVAVAILLAQRSLVQHVQRVAQGVRMSATDARRAVAMIVSRDTDQLSNPEIARAAIESGAENLSDGVIAPAVWALVGGVPGLVIYKLINTADSMIGYRTPEHENFGWACAKLDDVLNWLPARLTAGLLWIGGGLNGTWTDIAHDASLHKSPNAGWPESAISRALNISLAGPRRYHGQMQDLPWVNGRGLRDIGAAQIDATCTQLWRAWGIFAILCFILSVVF